MNRLFLAAVSAAVLAGAGGLAYREYRRRQAALNPDFYSGNGRLEATEIYVSAKHAGRIDKIFVEEGDLVRRGDKLVQMQTDVLEAQKAAVLARIKVKEGELAMARANVRQKESALSGAEREFRRQAALIGKDATSHQIHENAETAYKNAAANLEYARANVRTAEAQIEEQKAELAKIEVDIQDSLLSAVRDGRIQYLLAREGEIISAGGRVMNLVDLTDAYMTFFLPTRIAGKIRIGSEVRLVFDAAPQYPIPAKVTFIDPVAQFTPKSVETLAEREKLMFRVKAHIDPELLRKHLQTVKTGLPGVAWVKVRPQADWNQSPAKVEK